MTVGIAEIDSDHKTLIRLTNDLHRAIGDDEEYAIVGSVLRALEEYARHHFNREELVLAAVQYPQLPGHAEAHGRLSRQVQALRERYDGDRVTVRAKECLILLNKWLIDHICTTDMDYRGWVVGQAGLDAARDSLSLGGRSGAGLDWKALRLLLVDDSRNFCEVFRTILEGVGVRSIATAHDLATAQAALAGCTFDVVVCDWHVGREDGLDLVVWLRGHAQLATLPILMLSGRERAVNADIALAAGADDFMEKPISARGLLICLARLLARKERDACPAD